MRTGSSAQAQRSPPRRRAGARTPRCNGAPPGRDTTAFVRATARARLLQRHGRERQRGPTLTIASTIHAASAGRSPPTESASSGSTLGCSHCVSPALLSPLQMGRSVGPRRRPLPTQRRDFACTRASPAIGDGEGRLRRPFTALRCAETAHLARAGRCRTARAITLILALVRLPLSRGGYLSNSGRLAMWRRRARITPARTRSCWRGFRTRLRAWTIWSGCAGRTGSVARGA